MTKSTRKSPRRRSLPYIFSSERLDEALGRLLDDAAPELRLYVYRMWRGRKVIPALLKGAPFPQLLEHLRDRYGSGDYAILIRRGKHMELSGIAGILAPHNWRPRF